MQIPPTCVDELPDAIDSGVDPDAPALPCGQGCPSAQPVCDSLTTTCRACVADAECPGACHELLGTCTTAAATIYVATTGSDNATCAEASPCASISAGLSVVTPTRKMVRVANGTYPGGFTLRDDAIVSGPDVDAAGVQVMAVSGSGNLQTDPQVVSVIEGITITSPNNDGIVNRGTMTVSHVVITGAQRAGLDNRSGTLVVRDSKIASNMGLGINSSGAIDVQRTQVTNNAFGGITNTAASTIINNVIANNGGVQAQIGGVKLSGSPVVFRFNTIANNDGPPASGSGAQCDVAATLLDSIFFSNAGLFSTELGGMCTSRYSLFDSNPPSGTGNVGGNPMFVTPTDYHLQPGSPAIDKADPASTEVLDIDTAARPTGMARDIGADERP
jgi:hypothetical protein